MNVLLIREIAQTIAVLVVCIFIVILVVGCANIPLTHDQCNATKYATAMEHEQCLKAATKHEEMLQRRAEKRDKLITFLNACDKVPGLVISERKPRKTCCLPNKREQSKAVRSVGYPYTHDNVDESARIHNFRCVSSYKLNQDINRQRRERYGR